MSKLKSIALVIALLIVSIGVTYKITSTRSEIVEVKDVLASNISVSQKAIYLQDRYSAEISKWEVLSAHSDICSNKYVNELSTLKLQMNATVMGYEELKKLVEVEDYKDLNNQIADYDKRYKEYSELVNNINSEKYDEAVKNVGKLLEYDKKTYQNVDDEIASLGK